ncbi:MAG: hypothetical protein IKO56_04425 [Alphaproteobacteria bacterium]|nr:hypothetical protein [Alphaproteobacteria bacterium]
MDKNLTYCSYETCMLLKKKGFNELCDDFYCDAYLHEGKYVDPERVKDYKESDKKLTVKHGGMFCDLVNTNKDGSMDENSCSLVSQPVAAKWLYQQTNIYILVKPYVTMEGIFWLCNFLEPRKKQNDMGIYSKLTRMGFTTPELAYEFGINELAKNMK